MAIVKLRDPYEKIAGKVGGDDGNVLFVSLGRQFLRNMVIPENPDTANQQIIRNLLTQAAQAFGSLTDNERAAWVTYATNHPKKDSFGDDYTLQEMAAYVEVNVLRLINAQAISDVAPSTDPPWTVSDITGVTWDAGGPTIEITFTHTNTTVSNGFVKIEIAGPFASAQRNARDTDFRLVDGPAAGSVVVISDTSPQAPDFNDPVITPVVNQYLTVRLTPVSTDYIQGTPFEKKVQVAAA